MKISIFGIGYVGVISGACLASLGHDVIGVDIASAKVAMLKRGESPIVEPEADRLIADGVRTNRLDATTDTVDAVLRSDVSFVSVGTPSAPDGTASLAAVRSVVAAIGAAIRQKSTPHTVVTRSTVPPGTAESHLIPILEEASGRRQGDGLAYYANPEFMRESSAIRDFFSPAFTLIGAAAGDNASALRELYAPVAAPIHVCSYSVAESVKYLSNAYHALKLSFANEAGAVLAAYGVDAREAFRLFCEDRSLNISAAYLRPGFAFGGSCLPKDVRGFLALARDQHVATPLLQQILPSNESIVERAYAAIAQHGRQRVSLFGLAFKEGTDDLRESPFVLLAERLIGKGFDLRIFDRSVEVSRLMGKNRLYVEAEIPHLSRLMTANPADALEGSRLAVVGHIAQPDLPHLMSSLSDQTVIDLVGIPQLAAREGIIYQGICW
jgi:GDP-mannose 6-dehydrogenase